MLDVQAALKLNKKSWNAHYLNAQCHKSKNNLAEAILCYEMALAISPAQNHIKRELDSCKILDSVHRSNVDMNLDQLPISVNEVIGNEKDECGR